MTHSKKVLIELTKNIIFAYFNEFINQWLYILGCDIYKSHFTSHTSFKFSIVESDKLKNINRHKFSRIV